MKTCTKCGVEKALNEFYRNASKRDGYQYSCKACSEEYNRKWRTANPEKVREAGRKWAAANPEHDRKWAAANPEYARKWRAANPEYYRKWRADNPEKLRETTRKWRADNPEKLRAKDQRRRARKKALPSTLTERQWEAIKADYGYACAYCGAGWHEINGVLHQEHVIPVSQGGGYTKENIVPACNSCNSRKSGRTPEEAGMTLRKKAA